MQEIRFHGRGGQGTVVASILLAKAFFKAGYDVQTFPLFGVERRGAPVEAYLRLDKQKILTRNNVYTPDHVVVQDAKLLQSVDVTRGLKPGGWILLNTPNPPVKLNPFTGFRLAFVDATLIAVNKPQEIQTHCKLHLHNWKCPKEIAFVDELPRNTMGKVLKEKVKKLF